MSKMAEGSVADLPPAEIPPALEDHTQSHGAPSTLCALFIDKNINNFTLSSYENEKSSFQKEFGHPGRKIIFIKA